MGQDTAYCILVVWGGERGSMALSWFLIVYWSAHPSFVYRLQWLLKWSIFPWFFLSGLGHPSLFAWPSFDSLWLQTFWVFPHPAPGQALHPESTVGSLIPLPQQVPWLASGSQLCVHVMGTTGGFGVKIKFSLFLSPREGPQALRPSNLLKWSHSA